MIKVRLRQAMNLYSQRTGTKLTYVDLAVKTGISRATIEALGSRNDYNTTLATVDALCNALNCEIGEILEHSCESSDSKDANDH